MKSIKAENDRIVTATPVDDVLFLLRRSKSHDEDVSPYEAAQEAAKRVMKAAREARETVSS